MKRKQLPKSFLLAAAIFSLFSFAFVNLHASLTTPQHSCSQVILEQPQMKDTDDTDAQDIKVPNVTVMSRVIELVQTFLPVAN